MRPSQPCNTTCAVARDLSYRAMAALGPRRTGEWPLGKRTRPAITAKPEARRHHADHDEAEASDACVCPSTDRDEGEQ